MFLKLSHILSPPILKYIVSPNCQLLDFSKVRSSLKLLKLFHQTISRERTARLSESLLFITGTILKIDV